MHTTARHVPREAEMSSPTPAAFDLLRSWNPGWKLKTGGCTMKQWADQLGYLDGTSTGFLACHILEHCQHSPTSPSDGSARSAAASIAASCTLASCCKWAGVSRPLSASSMAMCWGKKSLEGSPNTRCVKRSTASLSSTELFC